jgi:hypothetical protein
MVAGRAESWSATDGFDDQVGGQPVVVDTAELEMTTATRFGRPASTGLRFC